MMNSLLKCLKTLGSMITLLIALNVQASQCKAHFVNPIKDICWNCLFPLTIGKSEVVKSGYPDTKNPGNPFCSCPAIVAGRLGITIGYWEPAALVDVTRKPYCMVNLGVQLNILHTSSCDLFSIK